MKEILPHFWRVQVNQFTEGNQKKTVKQAAKNILPHFQYDSLQ